MPNIQKPLLTFFVLNISCFYFCFIFLNTQEKKILYDRWCHSGAQHADTYIFSFLNSLTMACLHKFRQVHAGERLVQLQSTTAPINLMD